MSIYRRTIKRFMDMSIVLKYFLACALLLLTLAACCLYYVSQIYTNTYREEVMSAQSDFIDSYATLTRFEERMLHLVTLFQHNLAVNELLCSTPETATGEHLATRQTLLRQLYILLDRSDDYLCRLYVEESLSISDTTSFLLPIETLRNFQWGNEALKGWGWRHFYTGYTMGDKDSALIAPIRNLDNHSELIALLRIDLKTDALRRMMSSPRSGSYTATYLQSDDLSIAATTGLVTPPVDIRLLDQTTIQGFPSYDMTVTKLGKDTLIYQTLVSSGWRLMTLVSHDTLLSLISSQIVWLCVVGLALALFGILCASPVIISSSIRIQQFHWHVQRTQLGDQSHRLESQYDDEIGQLARAHNELLSRIEQLMADNEQNEQEMRRLELQALQSQIKPHFLYNTLEAVTWMAKLNQSDKVESTIRSLTKFYRLCLSKGKDVLSIRNELEIVQNYFNIQCTRFEQVFHLEIDVDESLLELELPKITLQPLVENAMVHGILESGQQEGTIRIFSRIDKEGCAELCIADTGAHFLPKHWNRIFASKEALVSTGDGEGYGLRNVDHRLRLFFKSPNALYLDTSDPSISCVVIGLYHTNRIEQ